MKKFLENLEKVFNVAWKVIITISGLIVLMIAGKRLYGDLDDNPIPDIVPEPNKPNLNEDKTDVKVDHDNENVSIDHDTDDKTKDILNKIKKVSKILFIGLFLFPFSKIQATNYQQQFSDLDLSALNRSELEFLSKKYVIISSEVPTTYNINPIKIKIFKDGSFEANTNTTTVRIKYDYGDNGFDVFNYTVSNVISVSVEKKKLNVYMGLGFNYNVDNILEQFAIIGCNVFTVKDLSITPAIGFNISGENKFDFYPAITYNINDILDLGFGVSVLKFGGFVTIGKSW
jgi:hypothetical protein